MRGRPQAVVRTCNALASKAAPGSFPFIGGYCVYPFPFLVTSDVTRISDPSAAGRKARRSSPSDRCQGSTGTAGMYTNGVDPKIPTDRRRARSLGLGAAPESTVGDVPTAPRGEGDVTSSDVRERPRGKLRLTAQRGMSLVRVVSAAQVHSSSFSYRFTAVNCSSTARQKGTSPR